MGATGARVAFGLCLHHAFGGNASVSVVPVCYCWSEALSLVFHLTLPGFALLQKEEVAGATPAGKGQGAALRPQPGELSLITIPTAQGQL